MPGIPKEEFEKELERIELAPRHAETAFAWMRDNGRQGAHGVWYIKTAPWQQAVWTTVDKNGNRYFLREAGKLTYLFALNEKDGLNQEPPFEKANDALPFWEWNNFEHVLEKLGFQPKRFSESTDSEANTPTTEDSMTDSIIENALRLLPQFYQIIFHGPPGTGKTRAAKQVLKRLFRLDESNDDGLQNLQGEKGQWDIVQFHPSYNYEDFVRGVQVETKGNNVAYETVNRAFGDMCRRANKQMQEAKEAKTTPLLYALIIDEINRANVSAVLGELIYGLEYRGKSVKTPYKIKNPNNPEDKGDPTLVIPENLYVIGTMNTADRTIGQIDYAVRRRFAFVPCPPNEEVVDKKGGKEVRKIYDKVQELFRKANNGGFLSSDFDATDVCIGHSYFLPSDEQAENSLHQIAQKIIWQVIPILREYVKDGILQDSEKLQEAIAEIEETAENLPKKSSAGESEESDLLADDENRDGGKRYYYWRKGDHYGVAGVGRTALGALTHFIEQHSDWTTEQLQKATTTLGRNNIFSSVRKDMPEGRYFDKDPIDHKGESLYVSDQWGVPLDKEPKLWNAFKEKMASHDYSIGQCHLVNLGESDSRSLVDSRKFGFVSARGQSHETQIREKIKKGDFLFINWAENGPGGYVGCGEVVEAAVRIDDFKPDNEKFLADCDVGDGMTYREKYPSAFDKKRPEWVLRVKWMPKDLSGTPIQGLQDAPGQFYRKVIQKNTFLKLRKAFDLPGYDT